MFYVWHTLIISVFVVVAYGLGYKYAMHKKNKTREHNKLLKALSTDTTQTSDIVTFNRPRNKPAKTSHADWRKGYHRWKKTQSK